MESLYEVQAAVAGISSDLNAREDLKKSSCHGSDESILEEILKLPSVSLSESPNLNQAANRLVETQTVNEPTLHDSSNVSHLAIPQGNDAAYGLSLVSEVVLHSNPTPETPAGILDSFFRFQPIEGSLVD